MQCAFLLQVYLIMPIVVWPVFVVSCSSCQSFIFLEINIPIIFRVKDYGRDCTEFPKNDIDLRENLVKEIENIKPLNIPA
jgi:hypothetical protein